MKPTYAIGDIHGQYDMLCNVLDWIETDGGPDANVVFLGDLVDRGPNSRGVIEHLIQGLAEGRNWTVLMGNHDRMFRRFVDDGTQHDPRILSGIGWLNPRLGGPMTLASYGVEDAENREVTDLMQAAQAAVPAAHRSFLAGLPTSHREPGLIFVHAGIRPGVPLEDQDEDDLVWIREPFLSETNPFEALIVHGHTALDAPMFYGNRVNLDSGAGYGRPLSVGVFEAGKVYSLTELGRSLLS
ncbi:metallophosphoesterase family protein [Phaeobacter sp. J2-8]|uniref:metallophosphoesterase family protein n=1 Tax=Phaeobacter sp. J2-8 TaxID=2931394 RepID=UPI001FD39186|nr:metallophosphoesterase family protein [Phaeobacter sp. J2-8]MCJ7872538.1 serine/threonine protein phosphatase [Phaeobacter sp. J2-8]